MWKKYDNVVPTRPDEYVRTGNVLPNNCKEYSMLIQKNNVVLRLFGELRVNLAQDDISGFGSYRHFCKEL